MVVGNGRAKELLYEDGMKRETETRNKWFQKTIIIIAISLGTIFILSQAKAVEITGILNDGWVIHDNALTGDKLSMLSANNGWMLSYGGKTANIYHWDGISWSNTGILSHTQDIIRGDIQIVSATDGWVVLGGPLGESASSVIYHWNGTAWTQFGIYTDPNETSMSAIDMVSPSEGWIVSAGAFWTNYYRWNGAVWVKATTSPTYTENDIDMVSSTDGWAVGFAGQTVRWNGSAWLEVPNPATSLNGIDMLSATDGWAVGNDGTIFHWNGTSWSQVTSPTTIRLFDVSMVSTADGWATGDNGILLHWDGSTWVQAASPVNSRITAIDMVSATDGWAIGWGGLLHYEPSNPTVMVNHAVGAPGSYFTFTGTDFPANSMAAISVNGLILGNVDTDNNGEFQFLLSTDFAWVGAYFVTASVNPSATTRFDLDINAAVQPQEGSGPTFDVPAGIAYTKFIYLPAILKN